MGAEYVAPRHRSSHHRYLPLSFFATSLPFFLLLLSLPPATLALRLDFSYPTAGDYNSVELRCVEMFGAVNSATFHLSRGGTAPEEEVVGETGDDGTMLFTLTPAKEGRLRCKSGDETSDWVPLAGIYFHSRHASV